MGLERIGFFLQKMCMEIMGQKSMETMGQKSMETMGQKSIRRIAVVLTIIIVPCYTQSTSMLFSHKFLSSEVADATIKCSLLPLSSNHTTTFLCSKDDFQKNMASICSED